MIGPSDADEAAPQRWTSWLPIAAAFALIVVLSLVPGLDDSFRLAIVALALLPVGAMKFILERRARR
jgi:Flp pilus assembly protein TadB